MVIRTYTIAIWSERLAGSEAQTDDLSVMTILTRCGRGLLSNLFTRGLANKISLIGAGPWVPHTKKSLIIYREHSTVQS